MKKLLLTLTAVAGLTFASQAQEYGFSKGNFIVEGNLNVNTENNKNTEVKTTQFNFTPKAGYFVTDKIAVGVNLGFGSDITDNKNTNVKNSANAFGAGVFGRYYFLEVGSRFKTYAEVNADYANTRTKVTTAGNSVDGPKANGFGVNAGIGANYFLTEKIAVNFAFANVIGYNTSKVKGHESVNEFGVNVNNFNNFFNTATFGLTFKF